jgi:hypothetical protein
MTTQSGRLRWARENAGYGSIRSAAIAFGWNENTYKSHEQGLRRDGGLTEVLLKKYARAFGVSTTWLAFGTGNPKRTEEAPDARELAEQLLKALGDR